MNIKILTLFPDLYPGPLGASIIGEALKKGIWQFEAIDIKNFASDTHKTVDDTPYGGGSGMVMKADILGKAIESVTEGKSEDYLILYPSPRGALLKQSDIHNFTKVTNILFICGRYEGIDQRIIDKYNITEFSIGDFILAGGEIASFAAMEAMIRTLPGALGNKNSLSEESFSLNSEYEHLLEYPLYTRPAIWQDLEVPEILISGNHQKISNWRLTKAKKVTKNRRPDLWEKYKAKNSS